MMDQKVTVQVKDLLDQDPGILVEAYQALEDLHSSVLDLEVQLEDLLGVPFEVALFETLLAHQVGVDLPYSWVAVEIAAAWGKHP